MGMSGHLDCRNSESGNRGNVSVAEETNFDLAEESSSSAVAFASAASAAGTPALIRVPTAWRALEFITAASVLAATAPLQLLLGALIRLGTPGPALFFQDRVGESGKSFKFVKFRTFYRDAKARWPELYGYSYTREEIESLKFKTMADPRVTPQGKWMRVSTLDELPNFWNVLTGGMALVGPRPEIPEMLRYYDTPEKMKKFSVRPGVTGIAQISGRGRLTFNQTLEYDLEYVRTCSPWLDLKIIFLTIYRILTKDGAF